MKIHRRVEIFRRLMADDSSLTGPLLSSLIESTNRDRFERQQPDSITMDRDQRD
jgi:hypothetical protein